MKQPISVTINGRRRDLLVSPHHTVLDVLRRQLKLLGTKEGCGVGVCGACTVLIDGRPVSACLELAANADGAEVLTIEGLARGDRLHPVQEAFLETSAFQCGFCTAGLILATKALLDEHPAPSPDEVTHYLMGNYCRCGNYLEIREAVQRAAEKTKDEGRTTKDERRRTTDDR